MVRRAMRLNHAFVAAAVVLSACQGQDAAAKRAKEKLKQQEIDKVDKAKKDVEAEAKKLDPKQSETVKFSIPMKSMAEAKEWKNKNLIGLSARVVFKLGKPDVDKKLHKVAKVTEKAAGETISIGGGTEDWGAGRLVHAELIGLRVA